MQVDLDSRADADVFEAIRLGNEEWRDPFFRRYERMVRNLIARHHGSTNDIDDLVSEAFLRFFERATHVRSAAGLRSYLFAIALYTARRDIRHRRRAPPAFAPERADETSSSDDPRARAALRQLELILLGMRSEDRDAYVLRQMVGLNLPRVASVLGVSLSTARRRVRAARLFVEKRAARTALLSEYVRLNGSTLRVSQDAPRGTRSEPS